MDEGTEPSLLPSIAALDSSTVRRLGASQVLVDPSSVVKELIDNALDARAKGIFVDISADTFSTIQVKDDGHGISTSDSALLCRRYCTSKIEDYGDIEHVGGKWLGFRGEALASLAEMSGALIITSRVEGQQVAARLVYGRNGELASTHRGSHPVGTTVKATDFFQYLPVRKEAASKNSTKCLATIRRMIQSYAFARPSVRFKLHVLKSKSTKRDFIYAPKPDSNVGNAALKIMGASCTQQCEWTVRGDDGYTIKAFLPTSSASPERINNHGCFISVDARPVCSRRGSFKTIAKIVLNKMRKSSSQLKDAKDPFFYMDISCPVGSYDPNVEPAKDDILFQDEDVVIDAVNKLLDSFYPEAPAAHNVQDPERSCEASQAHFVDVLPDQAHATFPGHGDAIPATSQQDDDLPQQDNVSWRGSMYGIDENDLNFVGGYQLPSLESSESIRASDISNPWTIAKMNAPVKPKRSPQLFSPAKSRSDQYSDLHQSPMSSPMRHMPTQPLTPQSQPRTNIPISSLLINGGDTSERRVPLSTVHNFNERNNIASLEEESDENEPSPNTRATIADNSVIPMAPVRIDHVIPLTRPSKPGKQTTRSSRKGRSQAEEAAQDSWFGQPMQGSPILQAPEKRRQSTRKKITIYPDVSRPRKDLPPLIIHESPAPSPIHSDNNTDIRDFFRTGNGQQNDAQTHHMRDSCPSPNPTSPIMRSGVGNSNMNRNLSTGDSGFNDDPSDIYEQLLAYAFREKGTQACSETVPEHNVHETSVPAQLTTQEVENETAFRELMHRSMPKAKSSRLRRRSTGVSTRSVTARLPLERVPKGCSTHNLFLKVKYSIPRMKEKSRTRDLTARVLPWGEPVTDPIVVFDEPIADTTIKDWVTKLDQMLFQRFGEKIDAGYDARIEYFSCIKTGLAARIKANSTPDVPSSSDATMSAHHVSSDNTLPADVAEDIYAMNIGSDDTFATAPELSQEPERQEEQASDDFEDGIEDDMLMDL